MGLSSFKNPVIACEKRRREIIGIDAKFKRYSITKKQREMNHEKFHSKACNIFLSADHFVIATGEDCSRKAFENKPTSACKFHKKLAIAVLLPVQLKIKCTKKIN